MINQFLNQLWIPHIIKKYKQDEFLTKPYSYSHYNSFTKDILPFILSARCKVVDRNGTRKPPSEIMDLLKLDPRRNYLVVGNQNHSPLTVQKITMEARVRIIYYKYDDQSVPCWVSRVMDQSYGVWFTDPEEFSKYLMDCVII